MPKILPDGDEFRSANLPQEVTHRYEAIMLWLLANPDKRIQDCAVALGYSAPWVSTVIHCDAFRERWIKMRGDYCGGAMANIEDKLQAVAHTALDKLMEQLEDMEDPAFLLKTSTETLKSLGYGSPTRLQVNVLPGSGTTNVQVVQDGGLLAQARAKRSIIIEAEQQPSPTVVMQIEQDSEQTGEDSDAAT